MIILLITSYVLLLLLFLMTMIMIIVNNIIDPSLFKDIIEIKLFNNNNKLIDECEYIIYNGNMIYDCIYLKNKLIFNKKVLLQNKFIIIINNSHSDSDYINIATII